jgi:RNase P/RNase MRP subunit p30
MILIQENNFESVRKKIIEANKNKEKIIFLSNNDELNRKVIEKLEIDVLLINLFKRRDFSKQRNSGFNSVLAKIAKKKKIKIGINLDEILDSNKKEKAEILGRIRQNIKICNKYKIKMEFFSIKKNINLYDLKSLGLVLGMPTEMIKEIKFFNL